MSSAQWMKLPSRLPVFYKYYSPPCPLPRISPTRSVPVSTVSSATTLRLFFLQVYIIVQPLVVYCGTLFAEGCTNSFHFPLLFCLEVLHSILSLCQRRFSCLRVYRGLWVKKVLKGIQVEKKKKKKKKDEIPESWVCSRNLISAQEY